VESGQKFLLQKIFPLACRLKVKKLNGSCFSPNPA